MSDSSLARLSSRVFFPKAALGFATALLGGYVLLGAFGVIGRSRTPTLEQFSEDTAVGDSHFFVQPAAFDPSTPVVTLEGQAFSLVDGQPVEVRDSKMRRKGIDSATGLSIYSVSPSALPPVPEKNAPQFYLKRGVGEYVGLRPAKSS